MGTPQTQSHHQQQHANNATMRDHTAAQARAAQRLKELWKNVPLTPEQMTEVKRLVRLVPDLAAIGLVAPPAPLKLVPSNLEKVPAEERLATLQAFVTSAEEPYEVVLARLLAEAEEQHSVAIKVVMAHGPYKGRWLRASLASEYARQYPPPRRVSDGGGIREPRPLVCCEREHLLA